MGASPWGGCQNVSFPPAGDLASFSTGSTDKNNQTKPISTTSRSTVRLTTGSQLVSSHPLSVSKHNPSYGSSEQWRLFLLKVMKCMSRGQCDLRYRSPWWFARVCPCLSLVVSPSDRHILNTTCLLVSVPIIILFYPPHHHFHQHRQRFYHHGPSIDNAIKIALLSKLVRSLKFLQSSMFLSTLMALLSLSAPPRKKST